MRDSPLVSIIIPTYNSGRTLNQCLKSVKKQTYETIEVIVVDRFSEDNTVEVSREHGAKMLFAGPERAAQKNVGALHANGKFLYFIDSDFLLEPEVVSKCVRRCDCSDALVVCNYSVGNGIWAKSLSLKRNAMDNPLTMAARFIVKEAFFEVGGFDKNLVIGEDVDLHNRLVEMGYRIRKVDAVEWHIGEPEELGAIAKRSYYYGASIRPYLRKRKGLAIRQLGPLQWKLFTNLLRKPSPYLLSLVVVDIVRYFAGFLGFIGSLLGGFSRNRRIALKHNFSFV